MKKHELDGIGGASAAAVIASLSANPSTSFLTAGLSGKILYWLLKKLFTYMASSGLVFMNVGAERLLTAIRKSGYDGSRENADLLIAEIRKTGRDLTPAEVKAIDDEVIKTFRKFGKFGRKNVREEFTP